MIAMGHHISLTTYIKVIGFNQKEYRISAKGLPKPCLSWGIYLIIFFVKSQTEFKSEKPLAFNCAWKGQNELSDISVI